MSTPEMVESHSAVQLTGKMTQIHNKDAKIATLKHKAWNLMTTIPSRLQFKSFPDHPFRLVPVPGKPSSISWNDNDNVQGIHEIP
jgi:hypothetical protein